MPVAGSGTVLTAHRCGLGGFAVQWLQRPQYLQLLVTDIVGVHVRRRLHGDQTEQLDHVVLDDVTKSAGVVVVGAAALDTESFRDGDLDMVDMRCVPQRFEKGIREAQRHQVLHRLFAEVVVDSVDLAFIEYRPDGVVDLLRRGEVVSDGLLDDDARVRRGEVVGTELGTDGAEELRGDRQVERANVVFVVPKGRAELAPPLVRLDIHTDEMKPLQKGLDFGVVVVIGRDMLTERFPRRLSIFFVADFSP